MANEVDSAEREADQVAGRDCIDELKANAIAESQSIRIDGRAVETSEALDFIGNARFGGESGLGGWHGSLAVRVNVRQD